VKTPALIKADVIGKDFSLFYPSKLHLNLLIDRCYNFFSRGSRNNFFAKGRNALTFQNYANDSFGRESFEMQPAGLRLLAAGEQS
jgi:hypothetical protein